MTTDRVVVIVDDGVTNPVAARAAVRAIRDTRPAHLMYAAPVCAAESADWLRTEADAVVHVHSPRDFPALGLWYRDLPTLTDDDVRLTLTRAWETAPAQ